MADKLRVLAVGAHPDDLEVSCAGTLAKYSKQGHEVIMCYVCKGDLGSYKHSPEEIVRLRAEEAKRSAEVIGAELVPGLGLRDGEVQVNEKNKMLLLDLIRRTKPDLAITHYWEDYMNDHYNTGKLVLEASFFSGIPNIKSNHLPHNVVVPIFYMESYTGINFCPTEYVDISDTFEAKKEMLSQHQSQLEFMYKHFGDDMLEAIEVEGRFWGRQAGVKYAEGFIPHRSYPRVAVKRLLP